MEEQNTPNILKNKYYLYMTEFFAGMSVMAVELGASRLLLLISVLRRLCGQLSLERL